MTNTLPESNPLSRAALALPSRSGALLAHVARPLAAAAALSIVLDQSYARTRILALVLAVLVLLTLLPLGGRLRLRLPWIAAGLLVMGGALLAHLSGGVAMIVLGALAAVGTAVDDVQAHRVTGAPAFFAGFGIALALITVIVLTIAG